MPLDFRDEYVAALELVRERFWRELAGAFRRLDLRDRGSPEYAETDWDELQRSIFDALALAVLDARGGSEPRAVTLEHASYLARERYWRAANTYFHVVWSRDVGRDGYVKQHWQDFEDRI